MMSSTLSSLQDRQKSHQRQRSSPVDFEAMKVQQMPPTIRPRENMHRRGQSFDMSRAAIQRATHRPGSAVSTATNNHGQPISREAQQQRMPIPGQPQSQYGRVIIPHHRPYQGPQHMQELQYDTTMDAVMSLPQDMAAHPHMQNIQPMMAVPQPAFHMNPQHVGMVQMPPQYANLMENVGRRASQPELRIHTGARPYTPMSQIHTGFYPITPVATPMGSGRQNYSQRYRAEHEIISPKPLSIQTSRSLQDIAEHKEMMAFSESCDLPTAAEHVQEPAKKTTMWKPREGTATPTQTKFDASVKLDQDFQPEFRPVPSSPARPALSPRRIEIADLHLDPGISASIEETNISLDEIAQYIEGPDPVDNKYVCTFEDCDKRFGRKENIKSHVQTHLGDRQFKCDHCLKRFVRGHDLKRHAKIHTGKKGYTCLCGNAFARHDALTRHRQRGMCIGAFDGIVRKEIKRGRPRKHRPEMDDRLDKAMRTRSSRIQQGQSQGDLYNSSASSCSISSWGSPVTEPMDNLSIHGGYGQSPAHISPYNDAMNLFGLTAEDMPPTAHHRLIYTENTAAPDVFSFTPPASPGFPCGNVTSGMGKEAPAVLSFNSQRGSNNVNTTASIDNFSHLSNVSISQPELPPQPLLPHISPTQLHAQLSSGRECFNLPASLPALSHSSSPPPESLSQSTNAPESLDFDFSSEDNALRMSTMSNISGLDFGMSLSKIQLPDFSVSRQEGTASGKNDFDSFLNMDDSQINLSMNGMGEDAFFAQMS